MRKEYDVTIEKNLGQGHPNIQIEAILAHNGLRSRDWTAEDTRRHGTQSRETAGQSYHSKQEEAQNKRNAQNDGPLPGSEASEYKPARQCRGIMHPRRIKRCYLRIKIIGRLFVL